MEDYIIANVKRCNKNLFITNIIILIGVMLILFSTHRYLFNALFGPFDMASSEIGNISNVESLAKYYVTIEGSDIVDTGLSDIRQKQNTTTKEITSTEYIADYLLLNVNDKIIVAKVPHEKGKVNKQTGELKRLPQDLENEILDIAAKQGISRDKFNERMLPVLIDTGDFKSGVYFELSACIILLIFALWNLFKFFIRTADYNRHPIIKELSKYGDFRQLSEGINEEINFREKGRFGNMVITDSWLFTTSIYSLKIMSLNDVIWMYKKVTRHSVNFIPTGKTYELIIHTRYKNAVNIRMGRSESSVDNAIRFIMNKIPWVIAGFSEEIRKIWVRNHNEVVAHVYDRRNQLRPDNSFGANNETVL